MSIPFPSAKQIPILGMPMVVGEADCIATLTCKCKDDNTPLLIRSIQGIVICPYCKKTFAIMSVKFDRQTGQGMETLIGQFVIHSPEL
jgi:hypothetical protein